MKTFKKEYLKGEYITAIKRTGNTRYEVHRHDYYEIILYKNCFGNCILNGLEYKIADSCIFLLTPEDYHKIDTIYDSHSNSIIISFSESIINETLLKELGFVPKIIYNPGYEVIESIEKLYDYCNFNHKHKNLKLFYTLNIALAYIIENGISPKNTAGVLGPAIRKAMSIVLNDLSKNNSLSDIAKKVGMTESYFSYLFHNETGKTFKKWITEIRIERAKRLIEESDIPIINISYECGYNTFSQFLKMFKRETSMTPNEYRKLQKNTV